MKSALFCLFLCCCSLNALADWRVDSNKSELVFVSTKNQHVSEILRFRQLTGSLTDNGKAEVRIALASLDSGIGIRDTRMHKHLFDLARFSEATINTQLDMQALPARGSSKAMTVKASLALQGKTLPLALDIQVTRLVNDQLLVTSRQPFLLNVSELGWQPGIAALQQLAGLQSIGLTVPVSFTLVFAPA